jgi:hypothetical protein
LINFCPTIQSAIAHPTLASRAGASNGPIVVDSKATMVCPFLRTLFTSFYKILSVSLAICRLFGHNHRRDGNSCIDNHSSHHQQASDLAHVFHLSSSMGCCHNSSCQPYFNRLTPIKTTAATREHHLQLCTFNPTPKPSIVCICCKSSTASMLKPSQTIRQGLAYGQYYFVSRKN